MSEFNSSQSIEAAIELIDLGLLSKEQQISYFTKSIKLYEKHAPKSYIDIIYYGEAYLSRGYYHYKEEEYDKAISDINKAIVINPYNPFAYCYRVIVLKAKFPKNKNVINSPEARAAHEHAWRDLHKALEIDKDCILAKDLITEMIKKGFSEAYFDICREESFLENSMRYPTLFNKNTKVLYSVNNKKASKEIIERTIIRRKIVDAILRGVVLNNAEEIIRCSLDIDKRNKALIYYNVALGYIADKKFGYAIEHLNKAIEYKADYAVFYDMRCLSYVKQLEYDKAIEDGNKAISIDPSNASTYENLAYAYSNKENPKEAIENYSMAINLDTNKRWKLYYRRGVEYNKIGLFDKAIADFTRYTEVSLNNSIMGYAYKILLYKTKGDEARRGGNKEKANDFYKKAWMENIAYRRRHAFQDKELANALTDMKNNIEKIQKYIPDDLRKEWESEFYNEGKNRSSEISLEVEKRKKINEDLRALYNNSQLYWLSAKEKMKCLTEAVNIYESLLPIYDNEKLLCTKVYIDRGTLYNEAKMYQEAIEDFTTAISMDYKNAEAYAGRARAYSRKDLNNQAIKDYNKAIEIDPNESSYYNNMACCYISIGEYDKAIEGFSKSIELESYEGLYYTNRAYSYFLKGTEYSKNGDIEKAGEYFEKSWIDYKIASSLKTNDKNIKIELIAHEQKFTRETLNTWRKNWLKNNQNITDISNRIRKSDFSKAKQLFEDSRIDILNFEEKLNYFKKAASYIDKYQPKSKTEIRIAVDLYDSYSALSFDFGNFKNSIKYVDKLIKINPNYYKAYYYQAGNYYITKQYEKAKKSINKAIRLNPDNSKLYMTRAMLSYCQNDYYHAINDISKAIDLSPDNASYYLKRSIYHFNKSTIYFEEALADCNKAISIDPSNVDLYTNRIHLYSRKSDEVKEIVKKDYYSELAWRDLKLLSLMHKGNKQFLDDLNEFESTFSKEKIKGWQNNWENNKPKIPHILFLHKAFYEIDKLFISALSPIIGIDNRLIRLSDIIALYENNKLNETDKKNLAKAYYHRGTAYYLNGESDKTLDDYNKAITLDTNNSSYYYSRACAYEEKKMYDLALADFTRAIDLSPDEPRYYSGRDRVLLIKKNLSV